MHVTPTIKERCSTHVSGSGTRLNHGDFVGVADGGEAVRDDDGGAARGKALQRALHEALADSVQRAGGLVQQQQAGVLEQRARNCNALLLPAAELHALLAHLHQIEWVMSLMVHKILPARGDVRRFSLGPTFVLTATDVFHTLSHAITDK